MGLADGHPAHVVDDDELRRDIWEEISQNAIAR